jgi:cyclohexadieny/prephenate dehydrogenase
MSAAISAPASAPGFDRVALIGIGLIGSSLARVLRREAPQIRIVACARRAETLAAARRLTIADETTDDPAAAVAGADLVVIATPLSAYAEIGRRIAPSLCDGAIVTDVGSVKGAAIAALQPALAGARVHFVPGHPVAGTEHSGPEAGFAELFRDRWCILTPLPETAPAAVERVAALWELAGMRVTTMAADHHDKVLAVTSHLPHLIAYTIVGTATELGQDLQSEVVAYSAGGFRDFTRIAASDPVMWRDIFLTNREAVLELLQRFSEDLTALQRAIRRGDGETLHKWFTRTRAIRRSIIEAKQA